MKKCKNRVTEMTIFFGEAVYHSYKTEAALKTVSNFFYFKQDLNGYLAYKFLCLFVCFIFGFFLFWFGFGVFLLPPKISSKLIWLFLGQRAGNALGIFHSLPSNI